MQQLNTKQTKSFSNYLYLFTALLILSFSSLALVEKVNRNSYGFLLTTLLLLVNLYFFIKVRWSKEFIKGEKIYSLFTTTIAIWFFLHCLLFIHPVVGESIGEGIFTLLNFFGFDMKGYLNSNAFSFFAANLFFLVVSIIEIRDSKSYRPIYLIGVILAAYIIMNYFIFYSTLIIN